MNENGTEAAVVAAVLMTTYESGEPDQRKYFTVNRPFLFAINEKTTGAILYIGERIKKTQSFLAGVKNRQRKTYGKFLREITCQENQVTEKSYFCKTLIA